MVRHGRRTAITVGTSLLSRRADPASTIVLTGSPRSGTTWVGALLATIPGSAVLFEPLQLDEVPEARRAGFRWRTYVDPQAAWPEGEAFMQRILEGRLLTNWTSREISAPRRVHTWVIKFVRANRLLPWLTRSFSIRTPVLLVRHPCAVVASRLARGWPTGLGRGDDEHPFGPEVKRYTASLRRDDEWLAAQWALDLLVPLTQPQPWPWEVIWFERLVREEEAHLKDVFDRWGLPMPSEVSERLAVWSSTTRRSTKGSDVLTQWRTELEPEQAARILRVVQKLGVTAYDEGSDPHPSPMFVCPSL